MITAGAKAEHRANEIIWWCSLVIVIGIGAMAALFAYRRPYQPYVGFCLVAFVAVLAMWWLRPRLALAITVCLVLIGDTVTVSWFPFNKNLSSYESIMWISDRLTISPLEITLGWALLVTGFRNFTTTGRVVFMAPLVKPLLLLGAFTVVGFVNGVLLRGGDLRVALFEMRPVMYLPLLYLLFANVCRNRRDYRWMFWAALVAITIQATLSLQFLDRLSPDQRDGLESLNEHGAALGMNLLFVVLIVAVTTHRVSRSFQWLLLFASIPVGVVYIVSQRRAGVIAFVAAMIMLAVTLFWRQRRTFFKVVPLAMLVVVGYTGAFWNSDATAAFPAQAIKSVVAPESISAEDQSSDFYREIENYDLSQTIRSSPVLGFGFGQPFLRPIPLPDISSFEFHEYIPHNSLLWIWIKTGFFGFATLFYIIARALMMGAERLRALPSGMDAVIAATGLYFVVMYAVYLFVDIAWEPRNVLLLALSLSLCTAPLTGSNAESPETVDSPEQRDKPVGAVAAAKLNELR